MIDIKDILSNLDKYSGFIATGRKDRIEFTSEMKPASYFVPDIHFSVAQAINKEEELRMAWFCEVFVNGRCIFREFTEMSQKLLTSEYEEQTLIKLVTSLFAYGLLKGIKDITNLDKYEIIDRKERGNEKV